jgi:hypothetical protein
LATTPSIPISISKLDIYETSANIFFEGPSRLINDETGETVGVAVTESMDVRIIQNVGDWRRKVGHEGSE